MIKIRRLYNIKACKYYNYKGIVENIKSKNNRFDINDFYRY